MHNLRVTQLMRYIYYSNLICTSTFLELENEEDKYN